MKPMSRSAFVFTAFCCLGFAHASVAQETIQSPQQQVKQATETFFESVNRRDTSPMDPYVTSAQDYFSAYPRDNPGGTIRNVRVLKTTIKGVDKALISGRLWVVPPKGKKGKVFTFEHSLIKKNNVWITESLHYNYIPNN